jgi:hypothetical protein
LYQEMLDKIDAIMTKKKNKEKIEDKWLFDDSTV